LLSLASLPSLPVKKHRPLLFPSTSYPPTSPPLPPDLDMDGAPAAGTYASSPLRLRLLPPSLCFSPHDGAANWIGRGTSRRTASARRRRCAGAGEPRRWPPSWMPPQRGFLLIVHVCSWAR
ncbi:hypothetical protein SORBI_3007G103500, partial [Sorghum bicolor]